MKSKGYLSNSQNLIYNERKGQEKSRKSNNELITDLTNVIIIYIKMTDRS